MKDKIQEIEGIPPDQQFLFFLGNELEDDCTLEDYHIKSKSTLSLCLVNHIFVTIPEKRTISLDVELETLVSSVKDKIQDREGIPHDQQCLKFMGMELEDDYTLRDYNVPYEGILNLS